MKSKFFHFKFPKTFAYFGILLPLMMLFKPQVKSHIRQECVKMTAGTNNILIEAMSKPCQLIAESLSECLIKEAENSGNILPILSDVISKNYGDASEAITKKCIASTIGLPKNILDKVPLAALIETMQNRKEKGKHSDIEDLQKDQSQILEDMPDSKPESPELELNPEDNQPEETKPDGQNKNKDEQDILEETQETLYKKEMPEISF